METQIKLGSIFSGIGGFELGLERAIPGAKTIWQVEQEPFCQKVLAKHWPNAKIYNDVRNITKNNVEPIDILCGGFPCQDISIAGKGKGIHEGKKSSLWWEMHRIISELRPRIAIMENVPAITFRGLNDVLGSLSEIGYDAEWTIISASQFGAPHKRERWFCVAYPNGEHCKEQPKHPIPMEKKHLFECGGCKTSQTATNPNNQSISDVNPSGISVEKEGNPQQRGAPWDSCSSEDGNDKTRCYWERFPTQSPLCHRDDGVSNRVARLRALGNAIVPQCSEWIGEQILNSGLLN